MATSSFAALNTLMELVCKELEQAVERVAKARKALDEAKEKSSMLSAYRQDYVDNLAGQLEKGLATEAYNNYQNFFRKLDQAISGQDEIVAAAQYQLKMQQALWQEVQRKKLSYDVLLDRAKKKAHHQSLKTDQKMMDEYAMRAKNLQRG